MKPLHYWQPRLVALEDRTTPTGSPFVNVSSQFVNSLPRGGDSAYDLQPTVLYDAADTRDANANGVPDALYKMWWLGRYHRPDADLPPDNLHADDRIYYRFSEDGVTWSAPQVVLKGQAGTGGAVTADDHLIGSPSVMRVGPKYYMFYEAIGTHVTPLNSFYSFARQDSFVTGFDPQYSYANGYLNGPHRANYLPDWNATYFDTTRPRVESPLGFAPTLAKAGTHPVYSGEVTYFLPGGPKVNRYLTRTLPADMPSPVNGEIRRSLHDEVVNGQFVPRPVFWLYDSPGPGRVPIYQFWDFDRFDSYATPDGGGRRVEEPHVHTVNTAPPELLGYAAQDLSSPDMVGAMRNRIMMATSADGVTWTRFVGPAWGGAVVSPQLEAVTASEYDLAAARAHQFPHANALVNAGGPDAIANWTSRRWTVSEYYGSGFPSALERYGQLELYFTDAVSDEFNYTARRVRLPLGQIENAQAWHDARLPGQPSLAQFAGYGNDIKWSDTYRRYFINWVDAETRKPEVVYSAFDPDPAVPYFTQPVPAVLQLGPGMGGFNDLPTGPNRRVNWGGLLADGLGHTLDNFNGTGMTRIDILHEAYTGEFNYFAMDLDHARLSFAPALGEVSGTLYDDRNGNGSRDAGEPGLAGGVVYRDANGNGSRDAGEPAVTTDAAGNYVLGGLPPAYSAIRVVPPPGHAITSPAGGVHSIANTAGELWSGRLFGVAASPPRVVGVQVNVGQPNATQRSRVTSITVTFSRTVTFAGPATSAFGLTRIGGGAVGGFTVAATVVNGVTVVTLSGFTGAETQFGSLADGRYAILVRANQVSAGGLALDGDGNGVAGDDYALNGSAVNGLFRLYGDATGDGVVNAQDFGQFRPAFGAAVGQAAYLDFLDLDGDGFISAFDFAQFRTRFGAGVP